MARTAKEVEKIKLTAEYYNGLAVATMAVGFLPFMFSTYQLTSSETIGWADFLVFDLSPAKIWPLFVMFIAFVLSNFLHRVGHRLLDKLD